MLCFEFPARACLDIVGGGVIGLGCALGVALARPNWRVRVWDPGPREGAASWAAAGMIAPAHELLGARNAAATEHVDLALISRRLWPGYAAQVQAIAGTDPGLDARPSWLASTTPAETAELAALVAASRSHGFDAELYAPPALPTRPAWGPRVTAVAELSSDIQVDNRALLVALAQAALAKGVELIPGRLQARPSDTDVVLVTAGWQTAGLTPWLGPLAQRISPVKGQLLALAPGSVSVPRVVRHGPIYIAPKSDRVVVGATVEPGQSDLDILSTEQDALLEAASLILPGLRDAPVIERWAGVRPATPDGAPLVGRMAEIGPPTLIAAGHFRNGVLLTPVTVAGVLSCLGISPGDAGFPEELAATLAPLMAAWRPERAFSSQASG